MNISVKTVKVGPERTNCYIVSTKSGETVVIDPGAEAEKILAELSKIQSLDLKYILLTHGHFDHVGAVDGIKRLYTEVPVMIHEADVELYNETTEQGVFVGRLLKNQKSEVEAVEDSQFLPFGDAEIEVLATPGHTLGGVCYIIKKEKLKNKKTSLRGDEVDAAISDNVLFSGDTLFYRTVGRTDLPLSSEGELRMSLDKLKYLQPSTIVYPGHGRETTIGEEVKNNPFL